LQPTTAWHWRQERIGGGGGAGCGLQQVHARFQCMPRTKASHTADSGAYLCTLPRFSAALNRFIWLRSFASYSPVFKRLPASIPVPYSPPSSVSQSAFEWAAQPQVGVRKMNQHRSQVSKFRHHTCECFPAHRGIYRRRAAVFEGISSESHAWHQACSWVCGIWTR